MRKRGIGSKDSSAYASTEKGRRKHNKRVIITKEDIGKRKEKYALERLTSKAKPVREYEEKYALLCPSGEEDHQRLSLTTEGGEEERVSR